MGVLQDTVIDEAVESATTLRRFANNSIRDVAVRRSRDSATVFEFLCECGDLRCQRLVRLTVTDYEGLRPGSVLAHAA